MALNRATHGGQGAGGEGRAGAEGGRTSHALLRALGLLAGLEPADDALDQPLDRRPRVRRAANLNLGVAAGLLVHLSTRAPTPSSH